MSCRMHINIKTTKPIGRLADVSIHTSQMLQSSMGINGHKNMECGTGRRHLSLVNMKKTETEKRSVAKASAPDVILLIEVDAAL